MNRFESSKLGDDGVVNSVIDLVFNMTTSPKHEPRNMLPGPVSGHLYYMADVSPELVENQTAYVARFLERNEPVWERMYKFRVSSGEFDISLDEKYFYAVLADLSLTLVQFDTENGDITQVVYCKGVIGMQGSQMVVSPDGQAVYVNVQNKATFNGTICRWLPSENKSVRCRELYGFSQPRLIVAITNTKLYSVFANYDYGPDPYRDTYLTLSDFFESTDTWSMKIPCTKDQ